MNLVLFAQQAPDQADQHHQAQGEQACLVEDLANFPPPLDRDAAQRQHSHRSWDYDHNRKGKQADGCQSAVPVVKVGQQNKD